MRRRRRQRWDEQGSDSETPQEAKKGGKLTSLWTDDVDNIDCGISYYQMGFQVCAATQKALYNYKPDDAVTAVPDLAESDPEISEDGKTVTVKIKQGVKFSPPVDREVTSKDVKYAIERGFFNTVNNGYAGAYFGDLEGAKVGAKPGAKIAGIETPDDQTIVFNLKKGTGGVVAGALALPLSAPVPEEYAKDIDAKNPSSYGQNQVATGPYMIENDASGKAIGYQAGRNIHLVRNPNWDESLDFKPAYLDEIEMPQGNDDTTVAARKILDGEAMINGDFSPDPPVLKQVTENSPDQLVLQPERRWSLDRHEHDDQAVRQPRRAACRGRGLRPRGHAPHPRRQADRRHPDPLHPAGGAGLRGGRWPGGSGHRLHVEAGR